MNCGKTVYVNDLIGQHIQSNTVCIQEELLGLQFIGTRWMPCAETNISILDFNFRNSGGYTALDDAVIFGKSINFDGERIIHSIYVWWNEYSIIKFVKDSRVF